MITGQQLTYPSAEDTFITCKKVLPRPLSGDATGYLYNSLCGTCVGEPTKYHHTYTCLSACNFFVVVVSWYNSLCGTCVGQPTKYHHSYTRFFLLCKLGNQDVSLHSASIELLQAMYILWITTTIRHLQVHNSNLNWTTQAPTKLIQNTLLTSYIIIHTVLALASVLASA